MRPSRVRIHGDALCLAGALVALALAGGCTQAGVMKRQADDLSEEIDRLRARDGARWAPREMAMAESHLDFFEQEYAERDWWDAEDDLAVVRENVQKASEIVFAKADTDGDGIPDVDDLCPDAPEVFNQHLDEDGCPDATGAALPAARLDVELSSRIHFEYAKAVLLPESKEALAGLVAQLRADPAMTVDVAGHTDAIGSDQANLQLSDARADAVRRYLVESGVETSRITATGYGEDRPIATNATPEGRAQNRRVEIWLR